LSSRADIVHREALDDDDNEDDVARVSDSDAGCERGARAIRFASASAATAQWHALLSREWSPFVVARAHADASADNDDDDALSTRCDLLVMRLLPRYVVLLNARVDQVNALLVLQIVTDYWRAFEVGVITALLFQHEFRIAVSR
jgi:hypothetical protein